MAGIYIHIPFCKSRCIYCAFYSTTELDQRQQYVDAVCREMNLRRKELSEPIHTIYIGGGTPSQLSISQIRQLLNAVGGTPSEITIECNPDDITPAFADALATLPINRVSMGAQTFDDDRLRILNRRHSSSQISDAVKRLRFAGIQNISIDLMYGFPNETIEDWLHDIDAALELNVEHLSAYCLMIEEGTPLYAKINHSEEESPSICNEELERKMYYNLIDRLTSEGFVHYEISNFAKPGFRSRHNNSYWTDVPYIGLGAAAHSYDGMRRQWNVSNLHKYIKGVNSGQLQFEYENIDDISHYNDRIMLSLRTCEGIDTSILNSSDRQYLLSQSSKYLQNGLLDLTDNRLVLTRNGLFVSDMVICDLMKI